MNSVKLQRIIQFISTIALFPILIYMFYLNDSVYYTASILSLLLISKVGSSIGNHRYFSHKSFKMSKWKEKIVAVLATLTTSGTILQYAAVHRYHHANSDNGKDLHSPYEMSLWACFFHWYKEDPSNVVGPSYVKDLLKNQFVLTLHQYYFLIIFSYVAILFLIDPMLIIFAYILPVGFSWWNGGILSLPLHIKGWGYRNFETTDFTNNSHFWNWLTLGEGLHNNHHARPGEYDFAFTKKSYEWDFSAWIVRNFLETK